jgi:uncharacterized LabA/DUF88 family protein
MTERSRRVVLLIDYDNLQICAARDTPGRDLQLPPVVQLAQRYGTVILARAYAEWNLSTERLAVYKAGIEPAFAPVLRTESDRSGKSLADTVMVAEGMDMLWTLSPEVVVLATSDKDLIPLVRVAKQRGAFVVVLGSDFTAIPLREMADDHVTYRQLITDTGVRYATEAGPGRQPAALPEPSRRRRERSGRDRGTSTAPAPSSQPTPRPEHEAAAASPASAPVAAPAATSVEPVAPVSVGAPGDADGQTTGRRRRRRGSRRRSDRLGLPVDGVLEGAEGADGEEEEDDAADLTAMPEGDVSPAAEITSAELSVTAVEEPEPADVADAVAQAVEIEGAPFAVAPVVEAEVAAVAERRPRRTRRRTTETAESPQVAPTSADEPEQAGAAPPAVPPQSADIEPAPRPEDVSVNGAPTAETAEPVRRPRRVASVAQTLDVTLARLSHNVRPSDERVVLPQTIRRPLARCLSHSPHTNVLSCVSQPPKSES